MSQVFWLLIVFQIKHFICDFPLQGQYMLGKFKGGWAWVKPLSAHAAVHAGCTALICFWWASPSDIWFLPVFDFVVHFLQDRLKASPNLLGRWKADNKFFWWALGQDQMVHHLTHYAIIWWLIGAIK